DHPRASASVLTAKRDPGVAAHPHRLFGERLNDRTLGATHTPCLLLDRTVRRGAEAHTERLALLRPLPASSHAAILSHKTYNVLNRIWRIGFAGSNRRGVHLLDLPAKRPDLVRRQSLCTPRAHSDMGSGSETEPSLAGANAVHR